MAMANGHWTQRSIEDFVYKISSDFAFQLVRKMDSEHLSQKTIADKLGVSVGRVSQVLNNPGNLTLKKCVQYAGILKMKTALVAYDDDDPDNNNGPVNSEIFYRCWQHAGRPRDFFELAESRSVRNLSNLAFGEYVFVYTFERQGSGNSEFVPGNPIAENSQGVTTTRELTYTT